MSEFGFHAIGATGFDNISANVIWCKCVAGGPSPATPASNGTLSGVWVYCENQVGSAIMDAAVYADAGGTPGSKLAENVTPVNVPPAGSPAWIFIDLSAANLSIVAGTQYWLAVLVGNSTGGADAAVAYTSVGSTEIEYAGGITFPSSGGGNTPVSERWSVYAEYTPSGGAPAVNPTDLRVSQRNRRKSARFR